MTDQMKPPDVGIPFVGSPLDPSRMPLEPAQPPSLHRPPEPPPPAPTDDLSPKVPR